MGSFNEQHIKAASAFAAITTATLETERGVHAETAIAGAARMAGTFLFRAFNLPLQDAKAGQVVLSEQANTEGPRLIQILGGVLEQMGVKLDQEKLGEAPGPENQPLLNFLETQRQLEPQYEAIRTGLGLSLREAADAAAIAAALLIRQTAQILDPHVAFGIAVYGFIEGTKTAPEAIA